jgi:dipeptide/tripeptide permease
LAYVIPIFGGWWADTRVGRYKAIVVGVIICGFSHVIMVIGAIPSILQAGRGMVSNHLASLAFLFPPFLKKIKKIK